ncbi:hypothetical protein [Paenibacillus physcomitrellae]|uniref:Uncharacterized protein n=1 Tax=Paenibacillus physcomitrellae TaxID=1619311 RepID=A0ABQ1FR03_9BACL|nr:hypothetical protein [Paenibacillus physcomitrellae]GGA27380.1 hypothetical protein GCM10010917_10310 [Paenibacillus physcomitrellae]
MGNADDKFDEMAEFNGHPLRSNLEDPVDKTYGDRMYEQYELLADYNAENDIPSDDLLPHDTRITQSLSAYGDEADRNEELLEQGALPDVPNADDVQPESPVDAAAQPVDVMHGTDLINGAGADEEDAPPLGGAQK